MRARPDLTTERAVAATLVLSREREGRSPRCKSGSMATIGGQMMLGRTLADKDNHIDWWQRCCT
ncbi:MAG TPA: hypothetical protein VE462_04830 [Propionibacteriaceae bacterium]|nr:hypothetical protein [Propionibacteriaceae bacterium]